MLCLESLSTKVPPSFEEEFSRLAEHNNLSASVFMFNILKSYVDGERADVLSKAAIFGIGNIDLVSMDSEVSEKRRAMFSRHLKLVSSN